MYFFLFDCLMNLVSHLNEHVSWASYHVKINYESDWEELEYVKSTWIDNPVDRLFLGYYLKFGGTQVKISLQYWLRVRWGGGGVKIISE